MVIENLFFFGNHLLTIETIRKKLIANVVKSSDLLVLPVDLQILASCCFVL